MTIKTVEESLWQTLIRDQEKVSDHAWFVHYQLVVFQKLLDHVWIFTRATWVLLVWAREVFNIVYCNINLVILHLIFLYFNIFFWLVLILHMWGSRLSFYVESALLKLVQGLRVWSLSRVGDIVIGQLWMRFLTGGKMLLLVIIRASVWNSTCRNLLKIIR